MIFKNDAEELNLYRSKSVFYFGVFSEFSDNLNLIEALLSTKIRNHYLWPETNMPDEKAEKNDESGHLRTSITVFVSSSEEANMINGLAAGYPQAIKNLLIKTIDSHQMNMMELFQEIPLFCPLVFEKIDDSPKDLTITIIGNEITCRYFFKGCILFGQMLDVRLHINVCSPEADLVKRKLETDSPELMQSCCRDSECLKIYPSRQDSPYAEPYAEKISFYTLEKQWVMDKNFQNLREQTDYFIISSGQEIETVSLAQALKLEIERDFLTKTNRRPKIIAFKVNRKNMGKSFIQKDLNPDTVILRPYGDLESLYTCQNALLDDTAIKGTFTRFSSKNKETILNSPYDYWSTAARCFHPPYKLYSADMIEKVNLNPDVLPDYQIRHQNLSSAMKHNLAWLEHRRWTAFLRAEGFRKPSVEEFNTYFASSHNHKNLNLRLHPCLVESTYGQKPETAYENMDGLDQLNSILKRDTKKYDYPDFDDSLMSFIKDEA